MHAIYCRLTFQVILDKIIIILSKFKKKLDLMHLKYNNIDSILYLGYHCCTLQESRHMLQESHVMILSS